MAATRCEFTVHCLPDDPLIITMSSNHDSSHTRRKPPMWTRTKWSWRPALRRWMRRRWMRRSKRRRWRRLRLSKGIAEPEGEVDAVKAETQADESTCEHKTNHSSPVSTLNHSPTLVTITCFLNITCHPKVVGRQTQASCCHAVEAAFENPILRDSWMPSAPWTKSRRDGRRAAAALRQTLRLRRKGHPSHTIS